MNRFWGWFHECSRTKTSFCPGQRERAGCKRSLSRTSRTTIYSSIIIFSSQGVVSIGETPGSPGGPGQSHGWDVYGNLRPIHGVRSSKPLTLEQKGLLIAGGVILAPHVVLALGGRHIALSAVRKGITMGVIPLSLSPGGGGPRDYPTSTETLTERDYRLMYGAY